MGVIPIHIDDRLRGSSEASVYGSAPLSTGSDRSARIPIIECHFELGHGECTGNTDLVQWPFIVGVALFGGHRSHHELARRHDNHFWAVLGAFAESVTWLERLLGFGRKRMGLKLCLHVWPLSRKPVPALHQVRLIEPPDQAPNDAERQS